MYLPNLIDNILTSQTTHCWCCKHTWQLLRLLNTSIGTSTAVQQISTHIHPSLRMPNLQLTHHHLNK